MKFPGNFKKLIHETRKGAVYAVVTGVTIGVVILMGLFINRLTGVV